MFKLFLCLSRLWSRCEPERGQPLPGLPRPKAVQPRTPPSHLQGKLRNYPWKVLVRSLNSGFFESLHCTWKAAKETGPESRFPCFYQVISLHTVKGIHCQEGV